MQNQGKSRGNQGVSQLDYEIKFIQTE